MNNNNEKSQGATLERRVAITILEEPIGEIAIGEDIYKVPAPTTATLIAVSALISELPELDLTIADEFLVAEVLSHAGAGRTLAKIVATLILGAKRILEDREVEVEDRFETDKVLRRRVGRLTWFRPKIHRIKELDYVSELIEKNCTHSKLREITYSIIKNSGLDDFFYLTTSLRAKNLLQRTREVENQTAFGH